MLHYKGIRYFTVYIKHSVL